MGLKMLNPWKLPDWPPPPLSQPWVGDIYILIFITPKNPKLSR